MKSIILSSLALVCLLPMVSSAFEYKDSQVYRLSDTTTLYTLTYTHSYLNATGTYPMTASETATELSNDIVGMTYSFLDGSDAVSHDTRGVVLSRESVIDTMYTVAPRTTGEFMLVVLLEDRDKRPHKLPELRVTQLQHLIEKESGERSVINPSGRIDSLVVIPE